MKYSINNNGFIVAERDIYSLGGFIPKGSVGCQVANGDQISQDGECWVAGGYISARPDVRVKDNAYIGSFTAGTGFRSDGVTEFSGDTLIPGTITVRNPVADPLNNFFCKDTFIGISMDVLCGSATGTNFPFEPGRYNQGAPKGTLFTSAEMKVVAGDFVRNTVPVRLGTDTYVYTPTGYNARIYWAYLDASGQLAYAGESFTVSQALTKLEHPVYKLCMIGFAKSPTLTPAELGASGAKILGHVSGPLLMDIRPESASGEYVMVNSSLIAETDNFGLATIQLRYLAGGMYNTNVYTDSNRGDYQVYGTFHNVQRLEYTKYLGNSHRTNVNRDRYISAYDCPLLRVDDTTYSDALAAKGDLVLRRCIVPKAEFQDDVVNGNTYEDIDFSFANEDLGYTMTGYARFISSHKQGIYRLSGGSSSAGFVSHKGNLADTARLYQAEKYIPLDGSIMEQGLYGYGDPGSYYKSGKSESSVRVRTDKPLPTFGLVFPTLPAGYSVRAFYYLDEGFIIRSSVTDPTGLDTTYPYVVMVFRKGNDSAINVTDFIALNRTLQMTDHTKAPEITGSAYVGAGCTVRGDVQLIGDPYVNRVFDVNMWERGNSQPLSGGKWQDGFFGNTAFNRFRSKDLIPVEPGGTVSRASGGSLVAWFFDEFGNRTASPGTGWVTSFIVPANVYFVGIVLEKTGGETLLTEDDIAISGIKYVRAFKKRRYIVNELDRTSPEDILIGPDYWEQGGLSNAEINAGKPHEELKIGSPYRIRLKRPFGLGAGYRVTFSPGYSFGTTYYDAVTKLLFGSTSTNENNALFALVGSIADSPTAPITPADVTAGRLIVEFTPSPRIVVPYGLSRITVGGAKVRMYDNAVLSKPMDATTQKGEIVLSGDAVARYDFVTGPCMCSNGHSDAIIKLP